MRLPIPAPPDMRVRIRRVAKPNAICKKVSLLDPGSRYAIDYFGLC
jgi:hypothetical protein